MQISAIPTKITVVWAASAGALTHAVPVPSQQPGSPLAASFTTGFPPDTFIAPGAGGGGPDGRDFNGVLGQLSAWNQWQAAGGPIIYDGTFQAAIGGYSNRATVLSATTPGAIWVSTADSNTTNPDSSGAGWADFFAPVYASPHLTGTPTAPQASATDNSTQIATTAYVQSLGANLPPTPSGGGATGALGQYQEAYDPGFPATSNSAAAVTNIAITAGNWEFEGFVSLAIPAGGASSHLIASISTSPTAIAGHSNFGTAETYAAQPASSTTSLPTGKCVIVASAPMTIYLVGQATFTTNATMSGGLSAKRI